MIKALIYVFIPCPSCGEDLVPLQVWIVEGPCDEDGHVDELEVDAIECYNCGELTEELCDLEELDRIADEVLDAFYQDGKSEIGFMCPVGEIMGYYRHLSRSERR